MRFTSTSPRSRRPSPLDLLYLNGRDLRKLPLIEGKAHLKKLIGDTDIQFSESFEVDGKKMYAHARKVRLERRRFESARQRLHLWPGQQLGGRKPACSGRHW